MAGGGGVSRQPENPPGYATALKWQMLQVCGEGTPRIIMPRAPRNLDPALAPTYCEHSLLSPFRFHIGIIMDCLHYIGAIPYFQTALHTLLRSSIPAASFFFGVRIMLGMNFNYLILWVRVKGQG